MLTVLTLTLGALVADPEPISATQVAAYEQMLRLSYEQRVAVTHHLERYTEAYDQSVEETPPVPEGHPDQLAVYLARRDQLVQLDAQFFGMVEAMLTEHQASRLPMVREIRRRQRSAAAHEFLRASRRPVAFIDEAMLASPFFEMDELPEELTTYVTEIGDLVASLEEESHDLWPRMYERMGTLHERGELTPDARAEIMREESADSLILAKKIDQATIKWATRFIDSLDVVRAADLMARFGHAQYPNMEGYWLRMRVWRELLSDESPIPIDANEFRAALEAAFRDIAAKDFKTLANTVWQVWPRTFPRGESPDGMAILERGRQLGDAASNRLEEICTSEPDGLSYERLYECWKWAARRAQRESPMFGNPQEIRYEAARRDRPVFSQHELESIAAKLNADEDTRAALEIVIHDYLEGVRDIEADDAPREEREAAILDAGATCLDELEQLTPRVGGSPVLDAARQCLERMPLYHASRGQGLASTDVARVILASGTIDERMILALTERLTAFHEAVVPALQKQIDAGEHDQRDSDAIRERARTLGEANATVSRESGRLLDALAGLEESTRGERSRIWRLVMPSLFAERDGVRGLVVEARATLDAAARSDRITDAWVRYTTKDDPLLAELIDMATRAHFWGPASDGPAVPRIPTSRGQIARAEQIAAERSRLASLARRSIELQIESP